MKAVWWFRTIMMFVYLSLLLMAVGALVGFIFNSNFIYWSLAFLAISLFICFFSYYNSKQMALKANKVRIIRREDNPRLYDMVAELAQKSGLPMPEVGISYTPVANAFATGRNPENAAVVATSGILDLLPDDELRGVLAHEMSHVRNRDILVMGIASAISIVISYVSQMAWYAAIFSRDSENRGMIMLAALAAQIVVPFAALLIQLGISRNREYLADESGARLINDPMALARALQHLERQNDATVQSYTLEDMARKDRNTPDATLNICTNRNYAHMWISNPLKKKGILESMFSTHPSTESRVARLTELAQKMGQ